MAKPFREWRKWQDNAPEALEVSVIAVNLATTGTSLRGTHKLVDAEAKVEKVHRSRNNIKCGDLIRIKYEHIDFVRPAPGDMESRILKNGERVPAFLVAVGAGVYAPAAHWQSFNPLIQGD